MAAAQASPAQIPLGAYIFRRLRSIGVHHIFGCPGDFNLNLLDHLYTVEDINWIGTCNELNGAYAADGYARVRGIPGVLVTTYGVGELSAINGISGAYSEHVPIIHIVGTTSRLAQKDHTMIHHTLGEQWDHDTFQQMSKPVRSAAANLVNDASFAEDVDKVIEVCVKTRKPVYIFVPMDTPDILISSERLDTPLDLEITNPGKEDIEAEIVELILNRMQTAEKPSVLVDVFAHRYGLAKVITEFLDFTAFPVSDACDARESQVLILS
jgi:pyruvate decarboxylase